MNNIKHNLKEPQGQSFHKPAEQKQHQRDSAFGYIKRIFKENTNEFCQNTTLHGLRYVVDGHLHLLEKMFFLTSFVVVVVVSIIFITNVYRKWQTTPVILSLNPIPTVISKVPFPAVTICNLNQAQKSKVEYFGNDTIEYAMLQTICHREINFSHFETKLNGWNSIGQYDVEDFIIHISQPCSSLLVACRFGGINFNCSQIFRPIVTDAGLCCVFNMVHPDFMYKTNVTNILNINYSDGSIPVDWDPEHGYPKELPPRFYPRTAAGTGENLGFTMIKNLEADEYYCSSANGKGLKVFLHNPTETPHVREVGLHLAAGTENKMRIRAEMFETDLSLRRMHKRYRQCLFDNEIALEYFSYYSKRNCEMECLSRMIVTHCDCVPHYMHRMYANATVCGLQHVECVEKYKRISMLSDENFYDCHDLCWAGCFDLTFDPDVFSIPISHDGFSVENQLVQNMSSQYASENIVITHMYFKENTYRSRKQTEFIGTTDFLSSTGGLMSLFMGFSFISLAEFLYFAFLRPYYNVKRKSRQRGSAKIANGDNAYRGNEFTKQLHQRRSLISQKCMPKLKTLRRSSKIAHKLSHSPTTPIWIDYGGGYYGLDLNTQHFGKSKERDK